MDEDTKKLLQAMQVKIDEIAASQERTRRHAQWSLWIMVALIVLPALGLLFAIPQFLATYSALQSF